MTSAVPDIIMRKPTVESRGCVDRQATFNQLYREHYDSVLGYAARRTDPDTARDSAAETFLVQDQNSGPDRVRDLADSVADQMQIGQALQGLAERDQEVLRLIGWEELDISEAALVMGCTRAAMAVRLHRARRRLALALQATEQPSAATVVAGR